MADKRLVAHALNRGGDDGRDANAQLAVVGEEFACVASRLDVRRGEPVLRRDLGAASWSESALPVSGVCFIPAPAGKRKTMLLLSMPSRTSVAASPSAEVSIGPSQYS